MNNITATTLSPCIVLSWSSDSADARGATLYICIIASVIHLIFWIQFLFNSSVRQRGMIWLYIYLLTDVFLLFRFFLFDGQRVSNVCVPRTARTYLCYFEAVSKFYTNIIQSYILLGLNVCRYLQIVFNRNVYIKNVRLLILSHLLIYILPMLNIVIQFLVNWTQLVRKLGGLCDIGYSSVYVQIFNLIITYAIPVFLNVIFLCLCIHYISSTRNIQNKQIINNRRKFHRTLVMQSVLFYSIWVILWSPFILTFPFVNVNSTVGIVTSTLNYVQVALDPIIVSAIDVRFLKAWKTTFGKIIRKRQQIHPSLITRTTRKN
jgi:hypothetical protein